MEAQLTGRRFALDEARPLRDNISTDEITPAASLGVFDERLGRILHTGFQSGGLRPIAEGAIQAGGFSVLVAGKRYGKGSSREHSPLAEHHAGIRLVIAESFERIYRQNADNIGLFTSTDLGLIDRINRGEAISVDELVEGRDALAAAILKAGGLLRYGAAARLRHASPSPWAAESRPLTLVEKILARHALESEDQPGRVIVGKGLFVRADWRFIIEAYTGMAIHLMESTFGDPVELVDTASIRGFAEHLAYFSESPAARIGSRRRDMERVYELHEHFCRKYGVKSHGRIPGGGSEGICHPVMTEQYALPGQLIVGTDSHTPHIGALGCLAFGVGTSDMASAMLTGAARLTVPQTLYVDVAGRLPIGVTAKDLVLHLLALPELRSDGSVGRVFEFGGDGVRAMSLDERATLTNMAAELGGFTGIVAPDAETVRFLKERRGVEVQLEPWMRSDPGATYAAVVRVDAASLSPVVSSPGDPGNGKPLSQISERPRVDIAFGGTCTGGKREDFDAYHEVLSWALARGRRVAPEVALYLQYGTLAVRDYCVARGYDQVFAAVGAEVLAPACGACVNVGPGASERSDQITVSAQNRNFPGRSGPGQVWLASPATVAASAIRGVLSSFAELCAEDEPAPTTG